MSDDALLVEDDPDIRKLLRRYLEKIGFEVREAATGRAALRALAEARPGLVLLDLMLPDLSGYEICEHVRRTEALCDVPVVIVSARALPLDRALAEEVGANAYLIKPPRWETFARTIEEVCRLRPAAAGVLSGRRVPAIS